jgi:hypothetical protein
MISSRALEVLFVIFVMLCLSPRTASASQPSECSAREMVEALKADDPAYPDAMELAQTLRAHGFTVKCVLASKMSRLFEGQKGAALYRTSRGDFEALFLPKGEVFAIRPNEQRENGMYIYSFGGTPLPSSQGWVFSRATYFTQHANQLFVTSDEQLAAGLDKALNSHLPLRPNNNS